MWSSANVARDEPVWGASQSVVLHGIPWSVDLDLALVARFATRTDQVRAVKEFRALVRR